MQITIEGKVPHISKTGVHVVNGLGNKYVTGQRPTSILLHKKQSIGNICQMWVYVHKHSPLGLINARNTAWLRFVFLVKSPIWYRSRILWDYHILMHSFFHVSNLEKRHMVAERMYTLSQHRSSNADILLTFYFLSLLSENCLFWKLPENL